MNIEDYRSNKKYKKKLVLKKSVKNFFSKCLIVIILVLSCLIVIKANPSFKNKIIKYVYEENINFTKFKNIYDKYFGKILSVDKVVPTEEKVFNENLTYEKANVYKDGVELKVDSNYLVPNLESGIVVFMGNKDGYGNTIIIEQINGIDVWYSNIETTDIKLYDYIEKGKLIGEAQNQKLYMVFQKDGKILNYKEYI